MFKRLTRNVGTVFATFALAPAALADWELNMTPGVTEITREVYDLHMLFFWVCVAIGVVVFGAMIWSIINHRASKNPTPATFSHSTAAEITWTVIPIVILVAMAYPAAKSLVAIEDAGNPDLSIKVTGYQWKWHYQYLEEDIDFFSSLATESNRARQVGSGANVYEVDNYLLDVDNPLVVPVDTKVRLLLTANDVIHAWWVPELSGKRDAIPGFTNQLWFKADKPGVYRGQCAELCGRDHGFMPIVVEVKSQDDYSAWLSERGVSTEPKTMVAGNASALLPSPNVVAPLSASNNDVPALAGAAATMVAEAPGMDKMMAAGKDIYMTRCAACHQANGQGMPPAFPAIAGSAVATGDLKAHIDVVLNGRAGTAMLGFGNQLNDDELAAVLTYQRNAFGNDTGDSVTPAQISAARKGTGE